jgi:hypothetical protein
LLIVFLYIPDFRDALANKWNDLTEEEKKQSIEKRWESYKRDGYESTVLYSISGSVVDTGDPFPEILDMTYQLMPGAYGKELWASKSEGDLYLMFLFLREHASDRREFRYRMASS